MTDRQLALRASMRVLPIAIDEIGSFDEHLQLVCFRGLVLVNVESALGTGIQEFEVLAFDLSVKLSSMVTRTPRHHATMAIADTMELYAGYPANAKSVIEHSKVAARTAFHTDFEQMLADDQKNEELELQNAKLWESRYFGHLTLAFGEVFPDFFVEKAWSRIWREWYQGFLDGKPLDWELQKEIALIPDVDWEKGPEWIAEKIEIIRKRRDLEAAIIAVKDEITQHRATIAHRSHNQPPEMVDEVPRQLTIIWDHLGEIEEEIAKENPAIETLQRLLARTLAYAKAIGLYCVSLGDAALKKAAEEIGSTGARWVVRMTAAYFAVQTPPVQSGLQKVGALLAALIKTLP